MSIGRLFVFALIMGAVSSAAAADKVGVSGSDVQYPTEATATVGNKKFPQKLTGTAMRKRAFFNVYTIGSYVSTDFKGTTADELASADVCKQLHLVVQRNVGGDDMANAFRTAIRANYPDGYETELKKLCDMISAQDVAKNENVWITHIPGYGLHVTLVGKKSEYIPGVKFAKAVWEIYLGPKNVGEAVKKALVSRL